MVLNYQRWKLNICDCEFQQSVDSESGKTSVEFAYNICKRHKPIAINQLSKTTLINKDFGVMHKDITHRMSESLKENTIKNLKDFDDDCQKKRNKLIQSFKVRNPDAMNMDDLLGVEEKRVYENLERKQQELRMAHVNSLTKHEDDCIEKIYIGLGDEHSLSCGDVYNAIQEELRLIKEELKKQIPQVG